jgi:RNA polymerase sigma factor (TIGR02999 family)
MRQNILNTAPDNGGKSVVLSEQRRAIDQVFSLVYEQLRGLATAARRREPHITLNSTALVHEAWIKLKDSPHLAATSPEHFKAIAARAMRQVLVEAARRRHSQKRECEFVYIEQDAIVGRSMGCAAELLSLDAALDRLAKMNARQAQMVEYRFYGGLSVAETAAVLGISESAVERDWRAARAWLAKALSPSASSESDCVDESSTLGANPGLRPPGGSAC